MKGRVFFSIFSCSLAVLLPALSFAYQNPGTPRGFVNDFAGLLKADERVNLESKIAAFENDTRNEIAVVTVENLGGDSVENFAAELFREWGIGKKGKDNGVLVLVAADDRKMRIEVGYGLEGALTDAQANWVIRNIMTPAFRAGDFYGGISRAVDKIISATEGEVLPSETANQNGRQLYSSFNFSDLVFFIFFVPIWIASALARSKSWWAGGIVGGIIGIIIGLFFGFLYFGIAAIVILALVGLIFDFFVSRTYARSVAGGLRPPWWIGGGRRGGGIFGGGSGGGFGGFGGGGSGGGGSSGSW